MRYLSVLIFCAVAVLSVNSQNVKIKPGPRYPPTKGKVWPEPRQENREDIYYLYKPSKFSFNITSNTCDILTKAVQRYSFTLRTNAHLVRLAQRLQKNKSRRSPPSPSQNVDFIRQLDINLTSPCEDYPYLGMDESYKLIVDKSSYLTASSIWGVLRGLETFSQLFFLTDDTDQGQEVRIFKTEILDYPRYQHRGLLLDTSRHFISLKNILKTLSAMAMNKMNVFHWHIVDDESFPYQSEKFPQLSAKGAYHPTMIYTKADIQKVIEYAIDRGIRVMPEFDVPGHTRSWGEAFPEVLSQCYNSGVKAGLGPMDPTNEDSYELLKPLIREVQDLFQDKYFHVGGDEVDLDCWSSNPSIQKYMQEHNMTESQLHGMFMKRVLPLLKENTAAVVWQEVYDEGVELENDVLVQVWKSSPVPEVVKVLKSGHKVLYSSSWYLDHLKSAGDWLGFYDADPREMVRDFVNETLLPNIVGGEACMWGEVVDDTNVISRVWPRASAVAERLWSSAPTLRARGGHAGGAGGAGDATSRLEEHACRMARRGVPAQPPNGPGFCFSSNL